MTVCELQGYPRELLPLTVAGIPSMHICLDFIPELIAQPHLDKQVTATLSFINSAEDSSALQDGHFFTIWHMSG